MRKNAEEKATRKAYTTVEVAKMIGATVGMVRYYCQRGYIPHKKIGNKYYIPAWWVAEWEKSPLEKEGTGK